MPMVITGSGFASNALMNTVTFPIAPWKNTSGVVQAMVQEATESYLKVVVPEFAGSGDVHVEANGQVSNGAAFSVDELGECVYWPDEENPFCTYWRCPDDSGRFCLNLQK